MKTIIVNKKYNNKKLINFLQDRFPDLPSTFFFKTLRKKNIKINGKHVNKNITIFEGDEIQIYLSDQLINKKIDVKIFYEDDNILIIDKPAGIEVTGSESLTTLIHNLYINCEYLPMPCHRLDRNTTGLLIFAKNEESLNILLYKFKHHEIEKHYLALVYGTPKQNHERLTAFLFKDSKKSLVYISDNFKKGYSKIITSYSLIEKYSNGTSLLDVQIETGKTHQIRAHLSHIGLPIVGDGKYGDYNINKKLNYSTQQLQSYIIKFNFLGNNGILDYLNGKVFELK